MFTGIIEAIGEVVDKKTIGTNLVLHITSPFLNELKVDQSVAHNGTCLTVTEITDAYYSVTLVQETLAKTNFFTINTESKLNLERCLRVSDRYDGHIVQGHVDQTAKVISIKDNNGSWNFGFGFETTENSILVDKGSICINGVSLTVVYCTETTFGVTIIPFTYEHTSFNTLKINDVVNIEFDILGKYLKKLINKNFIK